MVRCGCASDQCSCTIIAGNGVVVSGTGSRSNPYVVEAIASGGGSGEPAERLPGEIIMYGGASAPLGWLFCQGQELSRAVYSALFDVIGTTYGAGNGTTTFNIPDFRDASPLGNSSSRPRGSSGGAELHTLTTANLPSHTHSINHDHAATSTAVDGVHTQDSPHSKSPSTGTSHTTYAYGNAATATTITGSGSQHSHVVDIPLFTGSSGATGSATALDTRDPYLALPFMIKT